MSGDQRSSEIDAAWSEHTSAPTRMPDEMCPDCSGALVVDATQAQLERAHREGDVMTCSTRTVPCSNELHERE